MNMAEEKCTITGPLGLVIRVSSIVGITPIHIVRNPCGYIGSISRGRSFKRYVLISFLATSMILYCVIAFYFELYVVNIQESNLARVIQDAVSLLLTLVITIIATYQGTIRMKQTIKDLNEIEEVNIELNHDSLNVKNTKFFVCCFLILAATSIINIILGVFKINIFIVITCVIYYILFHFSTLVLMEFVFKVCLLIEPLRVLNNQLHDLIFKFDVFGSVMMYSATDGLKARSYCRIYLTIRHIIYKINKQEGLILMLFLTSFLCNIFSQVNYLTRQFSFNDPISMSTLVMISWIIKNIVSIVVLVEPCHQILQEIRKVHQLLSQLMSTSMERQLSKEFSIFSQHYLQRSPVFCPLGMVTLCRTLIVKIGGGILTYISVMSQLNRKGE